MSRLLVRISSSKASVSRSAERATPILFNVARSEAARCSSCCVLRLSSSERRFSNAFSTDFSSAATGTSRGRMANTLSLSLDFGGALAVPQTNHTPRIRGGRSLLNHRHVIFACIRDEDRRRFPFGRSVLVPVHWNEPISFLVSLRKIAGLAKGRK